MELNPASGVMFGPHHRLLVALPATLGSKTMMVPILFDSTCPFSFLATDVSRKFGYEGNICYIRSKVSDHEPIHILESPPNNHFRHVCLLGTDLHAEDCIEDAM